MKTVVVNYIGRKGGGAVYAYEMTKSLIENGCRVYAVISEEIENLSKWKELQLAELVQVPSYSSFAEYLIRTVWFWAWGRSRLKKKFKDIPIDAVYVPMIQPWTGLVNSVFKGKRILVTAHDPKPHSGSILFFDMLCRKAIRKADEVIILSEKFRDYIAKHYKKKNEHIHTIPHGIFDYYKKVQTDKGIISYDPDKINFLFFGRITKYKGLHLLADAYKRLSEEFENITLTIAGNGDFDEYREAFSKLKNVTIVNRWIPDEEVGCFFSGANVVTVLPYLDATQSGVVPIAMEYNSLVIASDTGGLAEQVKDNETGYLFQTGNAEALYQKMKYVIENFESQDAIRKRAQEYIRSLSWDRLGSKLLDII